MRASRTRIDRSRARHPGGARPFERTPRPGRDSAVTELGALLRLSIPMAIAQFGIIALSLVDTAAIGRVSVDDLAGAGIGRSIGFATMVVGLGVASRPRAAGCAGDRSRRARTRVAGLRDEPARDAAPLAPSAGGRLRRDARAAGARARRRRRQPRAPLSRRAGPGVRGDARARLGQDVPADARAHDARARRHARRQRGQRPREQPARSRRRRAARRRLAPPRVSRPSARSAAGSRSASSMVVMLAFVAVAALEYRAKGARRAHPARDRLSPRPPRRVCRCSPRSGSSRSSRSCRGRSVRRSRPRTTSRSASRAFTFMAAMGVSGATSVRVAYAIGAGTSPRRPGVVGIALGARRHDASAPSCSWRRPTLLMRVFTTDERVIAIGDGPASHRRGVPDLRRRPGRRHGRAARGGRRAIPLRGQRLRPLARRLPGGDGARLHAALRGPRPLVGAHGGPRLRERLARRPVLDPHAQPRSRGSDGLDFAYSLRQ